jgi:coenzyme F420-reducing hydrogenase beta subunit
MKLADKQIYTGCAACYSICSSECISMKQDTEGFLFPFICKEKCIECGKCEKACHANMLINERKPIQAYAAKNHDEEIRRKSSSGGMFTLFAEYIINEGGVVFGARFNDAWEVIHDYTETKEGLAAFRGSKYVQSIIGNTYKQAKDFLDKKRYVLYSGTPCQIAGLKCFLQKNYDNLFTIDLICKGVPSPMVWKEYLMELATPHSAREEWQKSILSFRFRDKIKGWHNFRYVFQIRKQNKQNIFTSVEGRKNPYRLGFSYALFLRTSCYYCPVKSLKSGSDITLGDYWGIENVLPEFDDNKGVSALLINTDYGDMLFKKISADVMETTYADVVKGNKKLIKSFRLSSQRHIFFRNWSKKKNVKQYIYMFTLTKEIKRSIVKIIKKNKYLLNMAKLIQKRYERCKNTA